MKKILFVSGFVTTFSLSLFSSVNVFAGSVTIKVPDNQKLEMQTVTYQCGTGTNKEKVEATYIDVGGVPLVDFTWKGERVIAANVIAASGVKYAGAQYIWWAAKNEVTIYDLVNDPKEEHPILCVEERVATPK